MEPEVNTSSNSNFGKELLFAFVIIIIALGAGLMIYKKSNQPVQIPVNTTQTTTQSSDPVVNSISAQSSSDEVSSIDADLKATDFSDLGK